MAASNSESLSTAIMQRAEPERACRLCEKIFPINLRCCPCLPTSWTKVQDWLHLVLIVGVFATLVCVVEMIWELAEGDCHSPLCFKQIISAVCIVPSTVYFIRTIGTYDEQLQEKKARHREEVENLIEEINVQVAEMNELCRKVTENANEFAVGRFNDKCEHFKRFLKGLDAHYKDLYIEDEMLQQLRSFVITWLRIFSGSLLSPQSSPLLRGLEAELQKCGTAGEVCKAAIRRLEESPVSFQFQMPAESPLMTGRGFQASFHSGYASGAEEAPGGSARTLCCGPDGRCGMTWLRFGRWNCCRREASATADRFPVTYYLGCARVRILSRQHANLLGAFWVDFALIVFEIFMERWTALALVAWNDICVISMLACFEQINEIAQLERQIHAYEQRSEEVRGRRDEARTNWEKVQQLHDLWLYRTLPELAILGKIHNHLADADMDRQKEVASGSAGADPRVGFLRLANESMDCLERKLGPIEDWSGPERLDERWKQSIGQQLKACEGNGDLKDLLIRLPIITSDLSMLEAPPPSASEDLLRPTPQGSPTGSPRGSARGSPTSSFTAPVPASGAGAAATASAGSASGSSASSSDRRRILPSWRSAH